MRIPYPARVALSLILLAGAAFGATKSSTILADTKFFSKEYADLVSQMRTLAGGNSTVRVEVPDPKPTIEAIRKAYGKPSKVVTEEAEGSIPVAVKVHYYDQIGFAVAVGDQEGEVGWLVIR